MASDFENLFLSKKGSLLYNWYHQFSRNGPQLAHTETRACVCVCVTQQQSKFHDKQFAIVTSLSLIISKPNAIAEGFDFCVSNWSEWKRERAGKSRGERERQYYICRILAFEIDRDCRPLTSTMNFCPNANKFGSFAIFILVSSHTHSLSYPHTQKDTNTQQHRQKNVSNGGAFSWENPMGSVDAVKALIFSFSHLRFLRFCHIVSNSKYYGNGNS